MRLIKIDPNNRTVEYIEHDGSLQAIYRTLDCQFIDVCARQDNGDALTIDDEALFLEPQPAVFTYNGSAPIPGLALLTGCDEEGETTEPRVSIEEATRLIGWLGEVNTAPALVIYSFS